MRVWNTRKQEIAPLTLPQATGGTDPLTYALTPELTFCFLAMQQNKENRVSDYSREPILR